MNANEPMSDRRLSQLRQYAASGNLGRSEAEELAAEVTRLLTVETKLRATIADEHTRLSRGLENDEELKALRIELGAAREHAQTARDQMAELGGYVVQLRAELAESRNALAVAAELIDRLAFDDACDYDHHDYCQAHNLHERPCPHPLGRQFVESWRAVEAEQQKAAGDV